MLEQIALNVAHANHDIEVVQGNRMNLRLHIGSILKGKLESMHPACGTDVSVGMAVEDCSGPSTHTYRDPSSQAHIIEILECMGCEDYDSSIRRLPHVHVRQQVLYTTNDEIDAVGMHRVENVFWRGVKAWARILLPNLRL